MIHKEVQIITPEQVSLRFKVAGLGSRATAQIIDGFLLGIILFVLTLGLAFIGRKISPSSASAPEGTGYAVAFLILLVFILLWGYFVLFEFFAAGRTPGKMLTGLRVLQDNGQGLTFLASALRNLFRLIDFLPSFYLLGMLMIFFQAKHKRVGDLVAGTLVVYQRKTGRKKKKNSLDKEMERRRKINRALPEFDEGALKKFGPREWNLIETYLARRASLTDADRQEMTRQVAEILLPLLGREAAGQPLAEMEDILFALYGRLREEWQYES